MKEALKMALEAVEEAVDCAKNGYISNYLDDWENAITAIKAALAQTEQEPVAWKLMPRDATDAMLKAMDECSTEGYDERLYAGHAASVYMAAWDASDTHPPQRTWVSLSDEEIHAEWLLTPQHDKAEGVWFGRRLEAKLKEKNT
jgi:hypothetical protein